MATTQQHYEHHQGFDRGRQATTYETWTTVDVRYDKRDVTRLIEDLTQARNEVAP